MSLRLRRSTRAKPPAKFNVGDTIEFKRRSKTGEGRLAFRLTEGDSPNPLWLVTFDGANVKDEEIYEKHFTKLLKKGEPKEKVPRKRRGGRRAVSTRGSAAAEPEEAKENGVIDVEKKSGEKITSTSSSDPEAGEGGGRGGKRRGSDRSSGVSEEKEDDDADDDAGAASDSSAPPQKRQSSPGGRASRAAARAARSLRRQAMIDEAVPTGPTRKGGVKRSHPGSSSAQDQSKRFQRDTTDEEVVVKVKLNTGTLYLYKGLNRRAVFVRRL